MKEKSPGAQEIPVLVLNGTIGSGKTTIGMAIHEMLTAANIPHAFIDLDQLTYSWPKKGRFNSELMFEALSELWPIYESAGADRLIVARVVETWSELEKYEQALGPCTFAIVRLKASEDVRTSRISNREFGDSLQWHLDRTVELEHILESNATASITIENEDTSPEEVAREILHRMGWL